MSVEVRPLGVLCNLQCTYCYQNPQRDAGNVAKRYDVRAIKSAVEQEGGPFTLFGGEPLLVDKADLEDLWAWGFVRWGRNGIQTNGSLIDETHLRLFRKYNVNVGISIDGPGELNDVRRHGKITQTRKSTLKTERNIELLCKEYRPPSLIVTLHRHNATNSSWPTMRDWFYKLDNLGISSIRLHVLESENNEVRESLGLSASENVEAFARFATLEHRLANIRFDLFTDMRNQLMGNDKHSTCVWNACDPLTTRAVRGIEGFGQRSNCGRTNKEGVDFVKADYEGFERYLALYMTPYEYGGCKGCRFFLMCKGQCPGTAIDGDWRNRTEHCELWMSLFNGLEQDLISSGQKPITMNAKLLRRLEGDAIEKWKAGENAYMTNLVA